MRFIRPESTTYQKQSVVVTAGYMNDVSVAKLGEVWVDKIGTVAVFCQFNVVLHLGVVDLSLNNIRL